MYQNRNSRDDIMWYIIAGCFLVSACAGESLYADEANSVRIKRQNHQQAQAPPAQHYSYRPYNEAPSQIKQLLQFQQAREPLVHLPAAAPPKLDAAPTVPAAQPAQYNPKVQYGQAPQQPTYKGIQAGGQQQQQQNAYRPQYNQPQPQQPAYRPAPAAPAQPYQQTQGQYPKNLPPHIQNIIDSQRAYQG